MEERSDEGEMYAAEESTPDIDKIEKVEPEKELCKSYDGRLSHFVGEESLENTEDVHDEAVRETLVDHAEGVRQNSPVEPNGVDVREVKEGDRVKEAIVPVDEASVENCEAETSPGLIASMVEPSLSLNHSATSAGQGLSRVSIPAKQDQRSDSRVATNLSVSPVLRSPVRDGYNWRKYGQKQVKSPKGSRSYYRCTHADCCAKKIECSSDSGNMIEIVNKGFHGHEPPQKINFSPRASRSVSSVTPPVSEGSTVVEELATVPRGSDLSASTEVNICHNTEGKRRCENEDAVEPEPKQRLKKENIESSDSVSKPGKKHKFVVHAAGDVGISGDGYRWRKYGQKMVKGNPNPRNYYRCTSAGCPVRKHIETAVENTTSVLITYKGVHNHDTPVPKKRHGPPSSMLVAAAAPASMKRSRPDEQMSVPTPSQCSVRRESEKQSSETLDVGGEKVMESARTLLSFGFEIKQC